jgi:threonine synthase
MIDHVTGLSCVICGTTYSVEEAGYVCLDHGNEGILDVQYDYDLVGSRISKASLQEDRDPTMWRYRTLLPMASDAAVPPLTVGGTPTYDARRLAAALGISRVFVKDEGRQPTASLKDRASAMAIVKAQEQGAEVVTTASTGNAAAALSGLSASIGQKNVIFVPETAPEAKIAQLLAYGFNPYMTEGKKTAGLEILEQLNWDPPDAIFVSVGDGSIIGGVHKAMKDAQALGWIDHTPRIFGIQSAGSDYLVQAYESGEDVVTKPPISADTVADSISADLPRDRIKAMNAVVETDGAYLRVSDIDILGAVPTLARGSGVFAEPAGAAAYAGLVAAVDQGLIKTADRVVVLSTGSGLKDVASAMKAVAAAGTKPMVVEPTLDALKAAMKTNQTV